MKKLLFILFFGVYFLGANAQADGFSPASDPYWSLTGNAGTTTANFIGTTDSKPLIYRTNNTERMRLLDDKPFLGVGTPNPIAPVHIHYLPPPMPPPDPPGDHLLKLLQITTPVSLNGFSVSFLFQNKAFFLYQHENSDFHILGPGGGIMISPNGNVGINNHNPSTKLDVGGSFKAQSASITGNTFLMGNVGIGTDNPQAKLDVGGSFKAQSASITGVLTANALSAPSANITGTLTANALSAPSANITGTLTANALSSPSANIAGTLTANVLSSSSANINGKIKTKEVEVTLSGWGDHVFDKDYNLMPLNEVAEYIKQNSHLPEIPSAKEVEENGVELGDMQRKLIIKIEELTLYILQLEQRLSGMEKMKGE